MSDRAQSARRGWEHRRERIERAAANIPAHLLPLWERESARFAFEGSPDHAAEAFVQWAESHDSDAIAAMQDSADRKLAALLAFDALTDSDSDITY